MHTVSHINYTVPNTTELVPTTVRLGSTSKSWGENRFSHCLNGEKKTRFKGSQQRNQQYSQRKLHSIA